MPHRSRPRRRAASNGAKIVLATLASRGARIALAALALLTPGLALAQAAPAQGSQTPAPGVQAPLAPAPAPGVGAALSSSGVETAPPAPGVSTATSRPSRQISVASHTGSLFPLIALSVRSTACSRRRTRACRARWRGTWAAHSRKALSARSSARMV